MVTVADDDARQDGNHRKGAWGEGQQQAETKEAEQHQWPTGVFQQAGDTTTFVSAGFGRATVACPGAGGLLQRTLQQTSAGEGHLGQVDFGALWGGRIADATVPAPLAADVQGEPALARWRGDRQQDGQRAAVGFHLAEELILVRLAGRFLRRTESDLGGLGLEAELVAVQVIALGHLEDDFDRLRIQRLGAQYEGLFGFDRVGVGQARQQQAGEQ
ncbi:hypothetical protein SDC9_158064 [bioreactor metagenome]|uniref:Uncharacterized protein n=1 Tax=bioreactor metagenome TaxID=1076179 RepID=A0A645F963_9ZZZZ